MTERRWTIQGFGAEWPRRVIDGPDLEFTEKVEVMPVADALKAIEETRKQVIAEVEAALTKLQRFHNIPIHGEYPGETMLRLGEVETALAAFKGGTDV